MQFTKMHGLGNDFVVVYGEKELPQNAAELAVKVCDRNFGVGADGLVYILPSQKADFMMQIINSDGSIGEHCGNAIRCVAKYVFDRGLTDRREISIETVGAGPLALQLTIDNGKVITVRVDMGEPVLEGVKAPVSVDQKQVMNQLIEIDGESFEFTAVSMGNPHCVIYVDDAVNYDLHKWGSKLANNEMFPNKTNVEFAKVNSTKQVDMRVWERGAGQTLACGTGACATLVASVLSGKTDREATISLKGGDLWIEWDKTSNHVFMTGPANEVFTGEF